MKRLLHALAALWPKVKEVGSPPTPPVSAGLRQHLAAVLRMEGILGECADLRICKSANETLGAVALNERSVLDVGLNLSEREQSNFANHQINDSTTRRLTESTAHQINDSTTRRFIDSPNQQIVESPNHPTSLPRIPQPMPLLTILMLVFFMCLMAAKQVSAQAEPAEAAKWDDVKWTPIGNKQISKPINEGLQVGDIIPEELWDVPLSLWSFSDNKTETVTLNDYRGKVIVLDFWSTRCVTCVYNMPRMFGLETTSPDKIRVLPVTMEEDVIVSRFFENTKYEPLIGLPVFSLVADKVLYDTFPSESLPHLVVLDLDGRVAAITQAIFLDVPTLTDLFNGASDIYIPRTRKGLSSTMLQLSDQYTETNRLHGSLYYSTLSGYLDGIGHNMSWSAHNVTNSKRYYVSNTTVAKLYSAALSSPFPLRPKRRILEVRDPSLYVFDVDNHYDLDFRRANTYTYEIVAPAILSREGIRKRMQADLDFMLGLSGRIEQRPVECWVLVAKKGMNLHEGEGIALRDLVFFMNNDPTLPIIINDTGYERQKTTIETPLPEGLTLAEYNAVLGSSGLKLIEETRMLDMFVLTENHEN